MATRRKGPSIDPRTMTQLDRNRWVTDHYTELVNWIEPKDRGGRGKDLKDFPDFPDQATHATAQAILSDDNNLKHFISQASAAEIKAEKKQRAGIRDDLRRQLGVLALLERNLIMDPADRPGRAAPEIGEAEPTPTA